MPTCDDCTLEAVDRVYAAIYDLAELAGPGFAWTTAYAASKSLRAVVADLPRDDSPPTLPTPSTR